MNFYRTGINIVIICAKDRIGKYSYSIKLNSHVSRKFASPWALLFRKQNKGGAIHDSSKKNYLCTWYGNLQ